MSVFGHFGRLLGLEPQGFTLIRSDGTRHNRIRGDIIPRNSIVIRSDGRIFVRTGEFDQSDFEVYREDFQTFSYGPPASTKVVHLHKVVG